MRLKSSNWLYLVISVPSVVLVASIAGAVFWTYKWAVIAIDALAILLAFKAVKKFSNMPKPLSSYSELKEVEDFSIPLEVDMDFFISPSLSQYDFMGRSAEIISPFSFGECRPKMVLNPKLLKEDKRFMEIVATREVLKYQSKTNVKNFAGIVLPITLMLVSVLLYALYRTQLSRIFSGIVLNFLIPFAIALIFVAFMFLWTSSISHRDTKLDIELLKYFKRHEVENFILKLEAYESEGDGVKGKTFNEYFAQERIKKLSSFKKK